MRSAFIEFTYNSLKQAGHGNKARIKTFFRSIQLYDMYIQNHQKGEIDQLALGLACIWVGSKIEEIYSLKGNDIMEMA